MKQRDKDLLYRKVKVISRRDTWFAVVPHVQFFTEEAAAGRYHPNLAFVLNVPNNRLKWMLKKSVKNRWQLLAEKAGLAHSSRITSGEQVVKEGDYTIASASEEDEDKEGKITWVNFHETPERRPADYRWNNQQTRVLAQERLCSLEGVWSWDDPHAMDEDEDDDPHEGVSEAQAGVGEGAAQEGAFGVCAAG